MKIIRYQDATGSVHHASLLPDGRALRLDGDLFGDFRVTDEEVRPRRLLAPVVPSAIICIGLNYK